MLDRFKHVLFKVLCMSLFFSCTFVSSLGIVHGSAVTNIEQIMNIVNVPFMQPEGNVNGIYFSMNNENLHLKPFLNEYMEKNIYDRNNTSQVVSIRGGYIKLMDEDDLADYISFPVNISPFFRAYRIQLDNGKEFLLVIEGKQAVSDRMATNLWLVGKENRKYVTYASIENIKNAGLIYQDILPKIENGELELMGIAKKRDCNIWTHRKDIPPYTYQGHPVSEFDSNSEYAKVNNVNLFWDDSNNWFGIRYAD